MANYEIIDFKNFDDCFAYCEVNNFHWNYKASIECGGIFGKLAHGMSIIYDARKHKGYLMGNDRYAEAQWERFKEKYASNKDNSTLNIELKKALVKKCWI
ncbi:MAG: hypothetical protein HUJ68_10765 [Clostridia bacterium]|nr:hypothetical protein [Clostridia bacterium]